MDKKLDRELFIEIMLKGKTPARAAYDYLAEARRSHEVTTELEQWILSDFAVAALYHANVRQFKDWPEFTKLRAEQQVAVYIDPSLNKLDQLTLWKENALIEHRIAK